MPDSVLNVVQPSGPGEPYRIEVRGVISGDKLPEMEQRILTAVKEMSQGVILDLSSVNYIDSRGISLCIRLYKECNAKNLQFSIATNSSLFRIFSISNLTNALHVTEVKP